MIRAAGLAPWVCQHPWGEECGHPAYLPEGPLHWGPRSCGVACVRICALALRLDVPSLPELLAEGRAAGAYVDGVGWRHDGLAALAGRHGMRAEPRTVSEHELRTVLAADELFIASVASTWRPGQRRGGHLVVVHRHDAERDVYGVVDPGRERQDLRTVPGDLLRDCWSGRGIALSA